jgi:hypothetical protein
MKRKANDNRESPVAAQEWRLRQGRCPVHGLSMGQIGVWSDQRRGGPVVACPRRDCGRSYRVVSTSQGFLLVFSEKVTP